MSEHQVLRSAISCQPENRRDPDFMVKAKAETGLVHVLTGDGPEKITSAMGIGLRAIGHGYRVYTSTLVKGKPNYLDILAARMPPNFTIIYSGREQFLDRKTPAKWTYS